MELCSHLLTTRLYVFWWPPLDVSTIGGGPQVNKFEQISSDKHQMSVAEAEGEGTLPYDLSHDTHEIPTPPPPN